MRIIIERDPAAMSQRSASIIAALVRAKPDAVLGLATGDTPIGLYRELVRLHAKEGLDFGQVTTFNLDEYLGLHPEHEQSYHRFMYQHLFDHINVPRGSIHIPDGLAADVDAHCADYEAEIAKAGGIDIQVLGIGSDGHIGFNEPGSPLASRTRLAVLDAQTIADNAKNFQRREDVPRAAITMGVGTILEGRTCLLLASGEHKAAVVAQAVEGPITSQISATALQLHPDTRVILDFCAAGDLARKASYMHTEQTLADLGR